MSKIWNQWRMTMDFGLALSLRQERDKSIGIDEWSKFWRTLNEKSEE